MKPWLVHYKNKFPGCQILSSANSFDVFAKNGAHLISIEKNGMGQWMDVSEEKACLSKHDLAPIPKNSRVWKLFRDGKIGLCEEAKERALIASKIISAYGHIPSIADLNPLQDVLSLDHKWSFDPSKDEKVSALEQSPPISVEGGEVKV